MKEQQKVRYGVVGCGVVATTYYLPYMLEDDRIEITAVCDIAETRVDACKRLFGAKEGYTDYYKMLDASSIDAVLILTAPGTHVSFALAAVERGLHVLIQKPMALNLEDATRITDAVRAANVKCLIEPGNMTPLHPGWREVRRLVEAGALGKPYWFSCIETAGTEYSKMLGGNPYGAKAFFTADSGGMLFDYSYTPSKIIAVLGDCKSVTGNAKISVPDRYIVPDEGYDEYLAHVEDPTQCNYWLEVLNREKTEPIKMEAPDNVFSTYELASGWIGTFHIGRPFHPVMKGSTSSDFMVFGEGGNIIGGQGYLASIISKERDLLPETDEDGWYHIEQPVNKSPRAGAWPRPSRFFDYYAESTKHLTDCIIEDKDPIPNVEWGRHVTEMMFGAIESSKTGQRYDMTTTSTGLVGNDTNG